MTNGRPRSAARRGARARWILGVAALLACGLPLASAAADPAADAFRAGRATAVLEYELALERFRVTVDGGVARVEASGLQPGDADRIRSALLALEGIREVVVVEAEAAAPSVPSEAAHEAQREAPPVELFPAQELFAALLADPRWPRFGLGYHRYLADPELGNVGAVALGESFALLGGSAPVGGRWELGVQGGVFSIFDLDATSTDLVNSDFLGGITAAYRSGAFSAMLRVFHQSSHLGDEFLLRNRVERVNLSFEEVDLLAAVDLANRLRLYGGVGVLVRREPSDLARLSAQTGLEFTAARAWWSGRLRPVAAVDVQLRQESDWRPDRSVVVGFQLESVPLRRLRLLLLGEYYAGRSPNGQFFEREVEYAGVSLRLGF